MTQLQTNTTQPKASAQEIDQHAPPTGRGLDLTWYATVLCRVGIHRGQWEYVAEGQCTQIRICGRCGATKARTKHQRTWRYVKGGACEQVRICKRCEAVTGDRTKHEEWGASYTVGRNTDAHRCKRCGVVQTWDTSAG